MNIIITHPRSGSHLAGAIYKTEAFTAVRKDAPEYPVPYIIQRIKTGKDVWFHYPFSQRLADYLASVEAEKYVLLRDPRDIIISIVHRVDEFPGTIVNYPHNGRRVSNYPIPERIDILIEMMDRPFHDFDQWRTCGALKPIYYADLVNDPMAQTYTDEKRRGIVGAYKDEMSREQIRRANQVYGDIIRYWKGRR